MRTSICHISDIHFKIGENAILNKMSQLSNAILQNLHKNDFVLFFITGDIAQSGSENEYLIALDFILYLKEQLFKAKNIRSYFWFVPGNHDCDFSDVDRNKSDKSFKDTILNSKESISLSDLNFYATNLIKKQSNYIEFYDIFKNDLLNNSDFKCNFIYESPFQWQCIVIFNNLEISINGLNTAWMSEIKEKPGILFIPGSEYIKIKKEKQLTFTLYHHPTSWMHPLDKNDFDRHVMKQSDIIYVGHEHNGRNETTKTRETIYNVQYGEVMQDPDNSEKSGFIINFIENNEMDTYVFRWEKNENLYRSDQYPTISLDKMKRNYLSFTNEFDKFLNTIDLQVLHKMKNDLKLKDLFVYPDFHYRDNKVSIDSKIKKEKIFGEQFFDFLYKYKKISFSGEYKCGKTALAKTIALDLIQKGIYPLYIDAVDLNSASDNYFSKFLDNIIIREYGEDSRDAYKQLKLNKTIILIDNLDRLNNSIIIDAFLYYLNKYFDHIISFSNKNYELGIIEKTLSKQNMDFAQCQICELGHAKRKKLIKNWYSLNENGIIVDDEINNKMAIAINTINILKGNGYMPCIPSHILIILQQLDYSQEKNPDRSSYGYLYEFLVTKSIIEMSKNCKYIHQDIVSGILTKLAYTMLVNKLKVISKIELQYLIKQYNLEYDTDANYEIYYDEFCKINLLKCSNDEISFSYNYIHYYYTAKYLSQTLSDKWTIDKISEMSKMLYDEECGDIMIFLCHLSKEVVIINSVLNNALTIFDKYEAFDFEKHKALDITEQSYVNMNFIPEEDIEYRQDELLNIKDKNEDVEFFIEEDNKAVMINQDQDQILDQDQINQIQELDNAFKAIDVMGQILKNYPGTIKGDIKRELLSNTHNVGMRTLTYINTILYNCAELIFNNLKSKLQSDKSKYDVNSDNIKYDLEKIVRAVNNHVDNLFGLLTYSMIRKLATALANDALLPLIDSSSLNNLQSFNLMSRSVKLNEFGNLQPDIVIKEYKALLENKNIFSSKILKLMVIDHFYYFGSADYKNRQKVCANLDIRTLPKTVLIETR